MPELRRLAVRLRALAAGVARAVTGRIHERVCPCCSEAGNADLLELTFGVAADEELGGVTCASPELKHELTLGAGRGVRRRAQARRVGLLRSLGPRPGS